MGEVPFAVVLPDVLIDDIAADLHQENLAAMVKRFEQNKISQIMVEPVPSESVSSYGIADCAGVEFYAGESQPMTAVVEKPSVADAPSNLAVVGRYVLPADIWNLLERTPSGAGGEIQLTDAIAMLMEKQRVEAFQIAGKSHDCGTKLGYMKANVEYALRHNLIGDEFKHFLYGLNII